MATATSDIRVQETAPHQASTVYIVDDDADFCHLTAALLRRDGYHVVPFCSAAEFLEQLPTDDLLPRCLVTDLRMPGIDGLQLQSVLESRGVRMLSIFLSGHANVAAAVEAMKGGAVEFLEKPVNPEVFRATVAATVQRDVETCESLLKQRNISKHLKTLTQREREVFELLVKGKSTKEIASALGINAKTVFVHRARVLEKMKVDGLVALSLLAAPMSVKHAAAERSAM